MSMARMARSLAMKRDKVKVFSIGLLPHCLVTGALIGLSLLQPDFGTGVVLAILLFTLLFAAGAPIGYLVGMALCALPVAWRLVASSPYRMRRITAFLEKPITLAKLLKAVDQGLNKVAPKAAGTLAPALMPTRLVGAEVTVEEAMTHHQILNGAAVMNGNGLMPTLPIGPQAQQTFNLDSPLREARDDFEKAYFEFHLARENGSMTRVAEKTGLERTHLYRKLKQLGVDLSRGKKGVA